MSLKEACITAVTKGEYNIQMLPTSYGLVKLRSACLADWMHRDSLGIISKGCKMDEQCWEFNWLRMALSWCKADRHENALRYLPEAHTSTLQSLDSISSLLPSGTYLQAMIPGDPSNTTLHLWWIDYVEISFSWNDPVMDRNWIIRIIHQVEIENTWFPYWGQWNLVLITVG